MLRKVAVLNSKVFGKAEITLDDADSIQLVGPNNIGKSTLIYALNFLFVIDGNKMAFSGQRRGDKETLHHYFPNPNQSYIVFEVFKNTYYCILVKRNTEGDLEYFRFNHEYTDQFFFENENGLQKLLKFEVVKEKLEAAGVAIEQFKNKTEVFNTVYQRGQSNNAVVWLEDTVKSDGLSNNFSKIYRYLINSKLITNKALKEALIIADNRENEGINFSEKSKKDITDLLRINDEIKNIKSIYNEFIAFREVVNQYNSKTRIVSEYLFAFNQHYPLVMTELEKRLVQKGTEITDLVTELNEVLKPKRDELNTKIGEKNTAINYETLHVTSKQKELDEINTFESMQFLNQALENLEKKRKEIEGNLTTIENQNLSSQFLEGKIKRLTADAEKLSNQIKNYNNLLIHKISSKPEHKKLLNSILSAQVTSLPSEQIKKPIKKITKLLNIFDGEIDLSKNIELEDFKTIEELKKEIDEIKKEKKGFEKLLQITKDFEKATNELNAIQAEITTIKEKIVKIKSKPGIEKAVGKLNAALAAVKAEKDALEKELKVLNKDINKKEEFLKSFDEDKRKFEVRLRELRDQKFELETIGIEPEPFETKEGLENIYHKIQIHQKDRAELKSSKDRTFDQLKGKIKSMIADEDEFIRFVEEEIACVNDKEKSIEGLLQSISTQFSNPAYTLVKRYEDFKQFIYDKFNKKLSETRISDIEALNIELNDNKRILDELRKISSIQEIKGQMMLEFDQSENLKILNTYLDNGKKVNFNELFDIELHLVKKGELKKVDLENEVESHGTDRMIRLVIIMSIINRLAVNEHGNRVALFIDEVATIDEQNRPELVRFCKEHFFIPVFAAPSPVEGFNKYYFLFPSKGKINVNEKQHTAYVERN